MLAFWKELGSLENRIYYLVLGVGIVASVMCGLMAIPQQLNALGVIGTFACTGVMLLLWFISRKWHKENVCRVVLVYVVNLVLFPVNFLVCGGLTSGMVLFYLIGLFNVAIMLRGIQRLVAFVVSLLAMEGSITLGRVVPGLVTPMTEWQQYQDVKITLFLTGATLVGMTVLLLRAYEGERRQARQLMEVQRMLSIKDPMTELYNRRELFRQLERVFEDSETGRTVRQTTFLAMFDVDGFKALNDTYGHLFGDEVLITVARILRGGCRGDEGELAARYGGEEFVLLLEAANEEEAFARVDVLREKIAEYRWEEVPELQVTVSGGVLCCRHYEQMNRATSTVDQLLYQAKHEGKNRICRLADRKASE